jgi:hypothetical protein
LLLPKSEPSKISLLVLVHRFCAEGGGFVPHVRLTKEHRLDPETTHIPMHVEEFLLVGYTNNDEVIDLGRISATREGFAALEGGVRGLHDLRGEG